MFGKKKEPDPQIPCQRCGGMMTSQGVQQIQLGETGLFTGTLSNILSGSLDVEIYICDNCNKIEFFYKE